ncbi:dihydrodipicolinate synthase family protein [Roseivivax sp. CAU 1761]
MTLFTGLSAFPLTPLDAEVRVMPDLLGRFLDRIVAAGVDSVGLLGSTGGYPYLDLDDRKRVLRLALERIEGRLPVIVGVGALRTDQAVDLARDADAAGAQGLLLAPVSYQPLTEEEVFRHFEAVAGATDLPLCIYNNPGTTHFTFGTELIARLADLPTVAAVKMPLPAGDDFAGDLARLRAVTPPDFSIGYSGDWGCRAALEAGGACWYSVAAGLLPAETLALARAAQGGDRARADALDRAFAPLWELFRRHGSFRVMHDLARLTDGAGIAPPRPLLPIPRAAADRLPDALAQVRAAVPA